MAQAKEVYMAQINVSNLTFAYEGSFDNVFENTSFSIDTDWRLGFIGRNGKGKTTFLNLLLGKYEYLGNISTNMIFDYFPYTVTKADMNKSADELIDKWKPDAEKWRVMCELPSLEIDAELLYRAFGTLSFGERTKLMLAVLFSGENEFLLIDEPTNHLDKQARELVKEYLSSKKGFILVSHDRDVLDACIDHVLVLNRATIEIQTGNFTSWWENKQKSDAYAIAENEKHAKEIDKLRQSADRANRWAIQSENSKIGFDPIKEHDRSIDTRAFIGTKTKKMQKHVKTYEKRISREIEEKEDLLKDIENVANLKIMPLSYHRDRLISGRACSLKYKDSDENVFSKITFEINAGEIVFIDGENGCGKTSLIRAILDVNAGVSEGNYSLDGVLEVPENLTVSYINQDTSGLKGMLRDYSEKAGVDYTLLLSLLRQLDFERTQFSKPMEQYSEGQKKKVLIATSLLVPAHLYIWDEPLNYIDVFTRMQIEKLIDYYKPTMLIVEHDVRFKEKMANKVIRLE